MNNPMSKAIAASCVAMVASVVLAAPKIVDTSVVASQNKGSRTVTVEYRLTGEPAIVTIDIQTNVVVSGEKKWVTIGGDKLVGFYGDVNILNKNTTSTSKAYWHPDKCWPDGGVLSGVRAVVTAWATNAPPNYVVIDLTKGKGKNLSFYARKEEIPLGVTNNIYKTDKLVMRRIPAKGVTWRMGKPGSGAWNYPDHLVAFTYDYYLGVFELTQRQFKHLNSSDFRSQFSGLPDSDMRPVEERALSSYRGKISDYANTELNCVDPNSICGLLNAKSGISFDLPTIEEWEYACRAGTGTTYYNGDDAANLGDIAWYSGNAGGETHPVGTRAPNGWGLYDMLGNASEWTRSGYSTVDKDATDCKNKAVIDPSTTLPTSDTVWDRGGSIFGSTSGVTSYLLEGHKWAQWNLYPYNVLIGARLRASAIITY